MPLPLSRPRCEYSAGGLALARVMEREKERSKNDDRD